MHVPERKRIVKGGTVGYVAEAVPFATRVRWAVSLDGHVAIVRPDPYAVDIIDPFGRRVRGPTQRNQRVRVDESLKRQWLAQTQEAEQRSVERSTVITHRRRAQLR